MQAGTADRIQRTEENGKTKSLYIFFSCHPVVHMFHSFIVTLTPSGAIQKFKSLFSSVAIPSFHNVAVVRTCFFCIFIPSKTAQSWHHNACSIHKIAMHTVRGKKIERKTQVISSFHLYFCALLSQCPFGISDVPAAMPLTHRAN